MSDVSGPAVRTEALTRSFGDRIAVNALSIEVHRGEAFGLLGPNGSGKSTLFRMLCTLLAPTSGTASVLDHDIVKDPGGVRRHIGVVFQAASVDDQLTLVENMTHQGHLYGLHGAALQDRIHELLKRFRLDDRMSDLVGILSGGLRRRLELAKGLLHFPGVLLLDEPTVGLDPKVRNEFWDIVSEVREETGVTLVYTSHIMEEAARADRLLVMSEGRQVAVDTPDNLRREIGGDVVSVETRSPDALCAKVRDLMQVEGTVVAGILRFQREDGFAFAAELSSRFDEDLDSITVGHPTLEDVFIQRTGRMLSEDEA